MGVTALGYVVIETTDLAKWDAYLTGVVGAMHSEASPKGVGLYRLDARPFRFWIEQSDHDAFAMAGWEMADAASFDTLIKRLRAAGREVEICDPSIRAIGGLARSSDPAGNRFEIFYGEKPTILKFASPAGVSGFVTGDHGTLGMGHVVYGALNMEECHHFYRDVMGFRDTDLPAFDLGIPGMPPVNAAFMHGATGRHHSVAVMAMPPSPAGCVHIMVEAATMDDVGRAYDRMHAAGIPVSATLGRHVNDEVTSFYMQSPGGFDVEFGYGGLIVNPADWKATAHEKISEWGHEWTWQKAMKEAPAQEAGV
jgi:3,4-dihydroxy-9,10-secoandrosta-1,3,5(10)-triene-9,17-dione 4,5-dioxygenase